MIRFLSFSSFLIAILLACGSSSKTQTPQESNATSQTAPSAGPKTKPNIVFIHVDDLGYHDLSMNGSKLHQTPNVDAIAKAGLSFTNAYSSYPRCTPSRYGLITGTYPVNEDHGHLSDIPADKNFFRILGGAGYASSFVGKWHLGGGENSPKGIGFTHSFAAGESGATGQQFHPFNKGGKADKEAMEDVDIVGKKGDYLSDLLTDQTLKFIDEKGGKQPFLAVLAFYAVHTPIEGKPEDVKRNKDELAGLKFGDTPEFVKEGTGMTKMRQNRADYAAMVENMDENVGRVMAMLKKKGIEDNTIIVFTSDHGGLSNQGPKKRDLATTNFPLRAGKGHLYEGGIRVPLLIKYPGTVKAGVDEKNIILGMDVYPTLLDLAIGYQVKGLDGKSYVPVMNGKESWQQRDVFWHELKARPNSTGDSPCTAVRSGDYKMLHFFKSNVYELYNLKKDISEANNLMEKEPEMAAKMKKKLSDWSAEYLVASKLNKKKKGKNNDNDE
jgi:arylsulfatase A-like enzyme